MTVWHWIGYIAGAYFGLTGLVALVFSRDYGRAACLARDVQATSKFLFALPVLVVMFIVYVIFYELPAEAWRHFTRKEPA